MTRSGLQLKGKLRYSISIVRAAPSRVRALTPEPIALVQPPKNWRHWNKNPIKPGEHYRQTPNRGERPPTYSRVYADCRTLADETRLFERSRISARK